MMFSSLENSTATFPGILLDAYGVFWEGSGLFPGSAKSMESLVSSGKIVGVLSNATELSLKELEKLERYGLFQGQHFHFFITSGDLVRSYFWEGAFPFDTPNKKFWIFGGAHPKTNRKVFDGSLFSETSSIEEADFIYLAAPHIQGEDQTDPELFRQAIERLISTKLPMLCPNPDLFAHEGFPSRPVVRQGTLAAQYEKVGGKVFYIGKPYKASYARAMEAFRSFGIDDPGSILMIGDTASTDIRGAKDFGMKAALVVEVGIMGDLVHKVGLEKAVAALDPSDTPDFFLRYFR